MGDAIRELRRYADKLKVSNLNDAKHDVIPVVQHIIQKIVSIDQRFQIKEIECAGSVYQKLKIGTGDEFDFDLPISGLETHHASGGITEEYTRYKLQPHQHCWMNLADAGGMLSPERVVQTFADLVRRAVDDLNNEGKFSYRLDFETNHPAVTVRFRRDGKLYYSVDLVPTIKLKSWPSNLTRGWESRSKNGWPTDDLINEIKMSSVSLVPKLSREMSIPLRDIAWRYSFNNAEKVLILDCDQDVANSCRRPVLRVLKGLRIDYNWQCIRSYHLKTIMLHEFESHHPRQWSNENFLLCFKKSLERLQVFLQNKNCPHYFLPGINLFNNFSDEACRQMLQDICRLLRDPYQALKELNDPDEDFQIFVRDLNAVTMTLMVKSATTIEELKDMISEKKRIDKSQFQMVFNGKYLVNGTIQSNGIQKESTIQMQARLRGGDTH